MAEKRKILFISHDASRTGAPMFLLNLLRWLRAHTDFQFSLVLRAGGALETQFRELAETIVTNDPSSEPGLLKDVALVYSNTCTNGMFISGLPLGTIPVITHAHEMEAILQSYGAVNLATVLGHSRKFIACSHAVAEGLRKFGVPETKIQVIHEAIPVSVVNAEAAKISAAELRGRHHWDHDVIVAGCGVADWRKGADLFLQIAQRIRQRMEPKWKFFSQTPKRKFLFLWIGILPPDERGLILQHDLDLLNLKGTVEFIGEQENPYPYLNLSDLFCLTSREDPFPLVMLEAAALGKPIVCFQKSGGAVELCDQGAGVAVPYLNLDAMAEAIIRLSENPAKRAAMGQQASLHVKTDYDFPSVGPLVVDVVKKTANGKARLGFARAQVFFPTADGYNENATVSVSLPDNVWTRLRFDLPALPAGGQFRFDPIDCLGTALIAGIKIKEKASGRTLWQAKNAAQFDTLIMAHTTRRMPDDRLLVVSSEIGDPHFLIPPVPPSPSDLRLEVWICAGNGPEISRRRSGSRDKTLAIH